MKLRGSWHRARAMPQAVGLGRAGAGQPADAAYAGPRQLLSAARAPSPRSARPATGTRQAHRTPVSERFSRLRPVTLPRSRGPFPDMQFHEVLCTTADYMGPLLDIKNGPLDRARSIVLGSGEPLLQRKVVQLPVLGPSSMGSQVPVPLRTDSAPIPTVPRFLNIGGWLLLPLRIPLRGVRPSCHAMAAGLWDFNIFSRSAMQWRRGF